jgi:hypothetical protein
MTSILNATLSPQHQNALAGTIGRIAIDAEGGATCALRLDLMGVVYGVELAPLAGTAVLARAKPGGDGLVRKLHHDSQSY